MQVAGIVAEYNPFHSGHLYHIDETRRLGATHIVAVMSGNFVQRAEPAIVNKFDRARIAALAGVDLVLELPVAYATASSERFAYGALSVLDALGIVNLLSFGSEAGEIAPLKLAAEAVHDSRVIRRIKQLTEIGENYPAAQTKALEVFYPEVAKLVTAPNNILGIDYLKALNKLKSEIQPITVPRMGAGHDEDEIVDGFASASRIRDIVRQRGAFGRYMPRECELMLLDATVAGRISGGMDRVESAILFRLRQLSREECNLLPDADTGLGDRLYNAAETAGTLEQLYEMTKTKRYTMSRVRRAVLAALLSITAEDYTSLPYIRILAIGNKGEEILRAMKKSCKLPVSHSLSELIVLKGIAEKTALKESFATDVFNLTLAKRAPKGEDFTTKLFKL